MLILGELFARALVDLVDIVDLVRSWCVDIAAMEYNLLGGPPAWHEGAGDGLVNGRNEFIGLQELLCDAKAS